MSESMKRRPSLLEILRVESKALNAFFNCRRAFLQGDNRRQSYWGRENKRWNLKSVGLQARMACLLILALALPAMGYDVFYYGTNFDTQFGPQYGQKVLVTALMYSNSVGGVQPRSYTCGQINQTFPAGFVISNMLAGQYQYEIQTTPRSSIYKFKIPGNSSGTGAYILTIGDAFNTPAGSGLLTYPEMTNYVAAHAGGGGSPQTNDLTKLPVVGAVGSNATFIPVLNSDTNIFTAIGFTTENGFDVTSANQHYYYARSELGIRIYTGNTSSLIYGFIVETNNPLIYYGTKFSFVNDTNGTADGYNPAMISDDAVVWKDSGGGIMPQPLYTGFGYYVPGLSGDGRGVTNIPRSILVPPNVTNAYADMSNSAPQFSRQALLTGADFTPYKLWFSGTGSGAKQWFHSVAFPGGIAGWGDPNILGIGDLAEPEIPVIVTCDNPARWSKSAAQIAGDIGTIAFQNNNTFGSGSLMSFARLRTNGVTETPIIVSYVDAQIGLVQSNAATGLLNGFYIAVMNRPVDFAICSPGGSSLDNGNWSVLQTEWSGHKLHIPHWTTAGVYSWRQGAGFADTMLFDCQAGTVTATNLGNVFGGAFTGNGSGLTNVASATNAQISDLAISSMNLSNGITVTNVTLDLRNGQTVRLLGPNGSDGYLFKWATDRLELSNHVSGSWVRFNDGIQLGNGANTTVINISQTTGDINATTFTGNGSSLTTLNANQIATGTVPDARLSANVPLLNAVNVFSGSNTFTTIVTNAAGAKSINWGSPGTLSLNPNAGSTATLVFSGPYTNAGHFQIIINSSGSSIAVGTWLTNTFATPITGNYSVNVMPKSKPGAAGWAYLGSGYVTNCLSTGFELGWQAVAPGSTPVLLEITILQ